MSTYSHSEDVLVREMEGELVLMDLQSEKYFSLNATGAFIWNAIEATSSVDQIAAQLAEEFGIDVPDAHTDTLSLIGELADAGLIVVS